MPFGCILMNVTHWTTAITDRPKLLKPGYSALSEMKWSPCDGWPHDSLESGSNVRERRTERRRGDSTYQVFVLIDTHGNQNPVKLELQVCCLFLFKVPGANLLGLFARVCDSINVAFANMLALRQVLLSTCTPDGGIQ